MQRGRVFRFFFRQERGCLHFTAGRQLFKSPVFSGGVPVGESVQGSGKGALEYGRPAGARLQQSERRPCGNRHDDPVLERGAAGEPFSPAFFPLPSRAFYGFFLNGAARLAHACSGDAGVFRQLKCIVQQDGGLANLVLGDQGGVVLRINLDKNFPAARPSRAVSGQNQEQQKKGKSHGNGRDQQEQPLPFACGSPQEQAQRADKHGKDDQPQPQRGGWG